MPAEVQKSMVHCTRNCLHCGLNTMDEPIPMENPMCAIQGNTGYIGQDSIPDFLRSWSRLQHQLSGYMGVGLSM